MKTALPFVIALSLAGLSKVSAEDGSTQVIVLSGTPAFEIPGNFSTFFGDPVLNSSGTVAFLGKNSSLGSAVYKTSNTGLLTIASTNSSTPQKSTAPFIGGSFTAFSDLLLNESGTVAFIGNNGILVNSLAASGIYTGSGGALTTIAATGQDAGLGVNENVTILGSLSLSDTGKVGFVAISSAGAADTTTPSGFFLGSGGGTPTSLSATPIAKTTQTAPGLGGAFTSLETPALNAVGASTFWGTNGTNSGIYASFGSSLITIATTLQAAPGIGGTFSSLVVPTINDKGSVVFIGRNDLEISLGIKRAGIFSGSGGAISQIATNYNPTNDPFFNAPGFIGKNFVTFLEPGISNSGVVAFKGQVDGGGSGVYRWVPSAVPSLQAVATTLTTAPTIGGNFSKFDRLTMNDVGTVAFLGTSTNGTTIKGIYLGDGQELITAAHTGQIAAGSTIKLLTFVGGADRGGNGQLNNNGQIAYRATLFNGTTSIHLFTPTLHFRTPASGLWGANTNWTVGILPAAVHDVLIDPTTSLTVTGPSVRTTVKSLTVNGTGTGIANFALQSSGVVTATDPIKGVTVGSSGKVTGSGKLFANLTNAGIIAPGTASSAGWLSVTGNVSLQSTSHLTFDLGGLTRKTGYDFLGVSGSFSLAGRLDLSLLGGFAPQLGNSFDLFDAGSFTGAFGQINLPTLTGGLGWNTSQFPTSGVISVVSAGPVEAVWNLNGSGSWAASENWLGGVPNTSGARATFGTPPGIVNSPATVTVSGAKVVGTIIFDSVNSYQVTGGSADAITLDNGSATPSIGVLNGSHTLAAPVVLTADTVISAAAALTLAGDISGANGLTLNGAGTVILTGQNTYSGVTVISAGTLKIGAGATGSLGTGAVTDNAALIFDRSGVLTVANAIAGTGTVTNSGAGILNLNGAQGYQTLNAEAGVTNVNGSFTTGTATVNANATVNFGASQTLAALRIGGSLSSLQGPPAIVPEPGSMGLLLVGALGALARRQRAAAPRS